MFGNFGRVRDQAEEVEGSLAPLGAPPRGGTGGDPLRTPIQRLLRVHPEISCNPHHFQHSGGYRDLDLGYAGRGGVSGI